MLRRKVITATAIGAALLMGHGVTQAAEEVGQAYLKGLGTYIDPDDDRNVDSGFVGGLGGFGYALSEHFNVELDFQRLNLDGDDGAEGGGSYPDQDQSALSVNLMNIYNRAGLFAPYGLLGLGVVNTDSDGDDNDGFQAQFGVGVLTRLWGSRLSLRSEVLGRYEDTSDDSLTDLLVNVGFSVALGSKPVPVAAPVAAVVAAPAAPSDRDGDGVTDPNDQCPETPQGERVGPYGCSCDVTRQLQFKFDTADLTDEDKVALDEVATNLNRLKFVSGTVVGHTDSTGTDAYNQDLSVRRAQSVSTYLQGKGIAVGRLAASGVGESDPLADNSTAEGRAQNRRVVLKRTDCEAPK